MSGGPWQPQPSPPRSPLGPATGAGGTLLPTLAAATVAASPSPPQQRGRVVVPVVRRAGAPVAALAGAASGSSNDRFFDARGGRTGSNGPGGGDSSSNDGGGGAGACTSELDEDDDGESLAPSSSGYTDDLIDEILENYRFTFQPEIRVKLRRRLPAPGSSAGGGSSGGSGGGGGGGGSSGGRGGGVAMCLCYSKPWQKEPRWRFTVKPGKHGWGGGARGLTLSASDREGAAEEEEGEEGEGAGAWRGDGDEQTLEGGRAAAGGATKAARRSGSPKRGVVVGGGGGPVAALQRLATAHVRKLLVVPSLSSAMLFTSKVPVLGVLRLQLAAGYNWRRRQPMLEYRLTTKWGADASGRLVRRKEEYQLSPACLLRAKWHLDAHFPDMEGHLGAAGGAEDGGGGGSSGGGAGGGAAAIDVDYGGMHFEVSQLDVVLDF